MITLKLPKTDPLFVDRPYSPKAINSLFSLVKNRSAPQALLLRADIQGSGLMLFILENRPFAAGRVTHDRYVPMTLGEFFKTLAGAPKAVLRLDGINPVLFKCLLATIQRSPTASGTTDMLNVEALLAKVRSTRNESVISARTKDSINFFFFIDGKLRESCLADSSMVSSDTSPEDQFLEFVYKASSDSPVFLQTYEDVKVEQAEDADLDWEEAGEGVVAYFLKARPELVFLSGGTVTKKTVNKKRFTIGRGPDNDVTVLDSKASRLHALILEDKGRFSLEDQKSRNGSQLNKQTVTRADLADGDEIHIGNTRILFTMGSVDTALPEPAASSDLDTTVMELFESSGSSQEESPVEAPEELSLRLENGPQKGLTIPLPDTLVIGRTRSDLNLNDTKVSRHHARIERKDKGYFFTDLNSTNGSLINDQPVKTKSLVSGDKIKLGETILEIIVRESQ